MRWAALALAAFAALALSAMMRGPWSAHLGSFFVLYAIAWFAGWRASRLQFGLRRVLVGAALFRVLCLPLAPSLSDDVYRYVWEGRIQNAGFDPYRLAPDAPELTPLRDDVWAHVNHRDLAAIYPPLSQLVFRGLAGIGGVMAFKIAFCLMDLAVIAIAGRVLRRRGLPMGRLILYAWNPLVVVEVAASGHLEPLGLLPLIGAIALLPQRRTWGWTALAASIALRYAAIVTLPVFARGARPGLRGAIAALAVAIGSFALYAGAGLHWFDSLRVYAEHWRYNASFFAVLERALPDPLLARPTAAIVVLLSSLWVAFRNPGLERGALVVLMLSLLLSPTVHPWYLCWPLALVPFVPQFPGNVIAAWSATMPLAYLYLYPAWGIGPLAAPSWGLQAVQGGVIACLLTPALRRRRTLESAPPPHPKRSASLGGGTSGPGAGRIVLVMPALDEERSLPLVFADLAGWRQGASALLDEVIVVDNGSRDRTPEIAQGAGATLLREPRRGYGAACQRALEYLRESPPQIVVFMDADRSDDASEIPALLAPIQDNRYDLVIGSRTLGEHEPGALLPQARFGNWLATGWIRSEYGFRYTDLGPFRAIRWTALEQLDMQDQNWGWTLEMQVRALQEGLRVREVPVRYRRRVGKSKISGTLLGSARAGWKILATMWELRRPG